MKQLFWSILAAAAISAAPAGAAYAECVRGNDVCLSVEDGTATATVDIGAIDAEVEVGPDDVGVTADAGAIDAQAGTDREECADAGAVNVPPDQPQCPPSG